MFGIKKRDTKQVFKAIPHQQGVSVSEVSRFFRHRNCIVRQDLY